jgi:hypothetical protein
MFVSVSQLFKTLVNGFTYVNPALVAMEKQMNAQDSTRLRGYKTKWDFYEGLHWEEIDPNDKPETTQNWCKRFVNTFASVEFSPGFSFKFDQSVEKSVLPFLNDVYSDNNMEAKFAEIGQMKNVTGDAYVHVAYIPKFLDNKKPNPEFNDPYDEYDKGMIKIYIVPSSICFPEFEDGYDTTAMSSCTIMYPLTPKPGTAGIVNDRVVIAKYTYTKDTVTYQEGNSEPITWKNKYGIIPIFHFKNLPFAGRHFGVSDLDDIIPMNAELNLKNSDVSEILDYHSSPITCVFGARVGQLEKGANKVWGGLPKDGKVQHLELQGDMGASKDYRTDLKESMHQIAGLPKIATGSMDIPANLSGVALHIAYMPLTEVREEKLKQTKTNIRNMNKFIIKIGKEEGLFTVPEGVSNKQLYTHEFIPGDYLPKDAIIELEQIQKELKLGVESRTGAMKRMKKDNIEETITAIDSDRKEHPLIYGVEMQLVASGQKLVNPETGKVVVDNPAPQPVTGIGDTSLKNKSNPVGTNAQGNDNKINSGLTNSNPGK